MADNGTIPELILLSDEPVASSGEDKLKMRTYAEIIAGAALHTAGPFTIGVFGKWGEGKTSLLKLAKALLDDSLSKPITVWFNAWQYDHEDHPLVPLAMAIADQVQAQIPEVSEGESRVLMPLRKIGQTLRAVAYGLSVKAPFVDIDGSKIIDHLEKLDRSDDVMLDPLLSGSVYQKAFDVLGRLVQQTASDDAAPPIVVFIDDLDRCLPGHALKLLQSIRLVLGQPGFVFAIALDREPIVQHLISIYEGLKVGDPEGAGQAYLDKIVQLPLWVPSHQLAFSDYIGELLETGAVKANVRVSEVLTSLTELLEVGTDANPRALVRLINNLIVDNVLWADRQDIADWLGLCAVSRLLREKLGSGKYLSLVRNRRLCLELVGEGKDESVDWRSKGKLDRAERSPDDELQYSVFRIRERTPAIRALLETPLGKRWLTEHETRLQIDRFLTSERRDTITQVSEDGEAAIDRAIRTSLGLDGDIPITQEHRDNVKTLEFSFGPISNGDMLFISSMKSLSRLVLFGSRITDTGLGHLKGLTSLSSLSL
ncbi:P-loop NTPase fold protein, partial [Candidatus Bipolaricaulota bacterium]